MDTSFFQKHGSTILTCIGAIGTVTTAVLAAKAAPKASRLLFEAQDEKGEELTKVEKIKVAAPSYIPAIVMGASTVACIFGANALNKRQQALMTSAYAFLSASYDEYRRKVNELYGEDADNRVVDEMAKEVFEEDKDNWPEVESEDDLLFYDMSANEYFTARMDDVIQKTVTDDGLEVYRICSPYDTPPWYRW